MMDHYESLLNPVGAASAGRADADAHGRKRAGARVVGLIDNSKPNVAFFLDAIEDALRAQGGLEIVRVMKSRSAAPYSDLAALAGQCDFVVNAVAD